MSVFQPSMVKFQKSKCFKMVSLLIIPILSVVSTWIQHRCRSSSLGGINLEWSFFMPSQGFLGTREHG